MNDRHVALIGAFFDALGRGDLATVEQCYHPEVSFGDPIFQEIEGRDRVMRMWRVQHRMRTELHLAYRDLWADDHSGTARWSVDYVVAGTGRRVTDRIESLFRFDDGLIVRHHDDFDFRRWSKMALGKPHGLLFGWTPSWRQSIRDRAARQLEELQPS